MQRNKETKILLKKYKAGGLTNQQSRQCKERVIKQSSMDREQTYK